MIRVSDQSWWCYDDTKSPRQLTDADHSHLYRNMYIAALAHASASQFSVALTSDSTQHGSAETGCEHVRTELGWQ